MSPRVNKETKGSPVILQVVLFITNISYSNVRDGISGGPVNWLEGNIDADPLYVDAENGDLYIGDVGQSSWEEIDYLPAKSSGANFGWNIMEGNHCFDEKNLCDSSLYELPIYEYPNNANYLKTQLLHVFRLYECLFLKRLFQIYHHL